MSSLQSHLLLLPFYFSCLHRSMSWMLSAPTAIRYSRRNDHGSSGACFAHTETSANRRHLLFQAAFIDSTARSIGSVMSASAVEAPERSVDAVTKAAAVDDVYTRIEKTFSYRFQPPPGSNRTNKPLKTHLDEVNFVSSGVNAGITVDPVRINSLREFGTPEEVAAKVVLAEVNRDGVFDVTLMEDPLVVESSNNTLFYELNYLSVGKRGQKRFVTRFAIKDRNLYALTIQCKQDEYETLKPIIATAAQSFQVGLIAPN